MENTLVANYDIAEPDFIANPHRVYAHLRRHHPVAVSHLWGGSVMLTRYADIVDVAKSTQDFSSASVSVAKNPHRTSSGEYPALRLPPLTSDPPEHSDNRRPLAPSLSRKAAAAAATAVRARCHTLIDQFAGRSHVDAVRDYSLQIPAWVISWVLGIGDEHCEALTRWARSSLEVRVAEADGPSRGAQLMDLLVELVSRAKADRYADGLLGRLCRGRDDWSERHLLGTLKLLVVAGIDSTAQTIASVLLHLAVHEEDQAALRSEPEVSRLAVEELLRLFAPTTMARMATRDVRLHGVLIPAGTRVILPFPAANRDPQVFEQPDELVLNRSPNPHLAFGYGIHRCLGAPFAQMELQTAITTWLQRSEWFRLEKGAEITWVGGQVRGPERLPVTFLHSG